ncbi:MAG: hypothetical protein J6A57_05865 [Ruminococcus sp.]|nr:hypothetical protein [Ruminococcus sp.]
MKILLPILILAIFGSIQFVMASRIKCKAVKFLPAIISSLAVIACLAVYLGSYAISSESVMAENQYFAAFLGTYTGAAMIGSFLALIIAKFLKNRNWGK